MKTRGSKYSLRCMVMNASQSLNARNLLAATTRGHSISRKVCGVCGSILELAAPVQIMGTNCWITKYQYRKVCCSETPCSRSGGVSICVHTLFFLKIKKNCRYLQVTKGLMNVQSIMESFDRMNNNSYSGKFLCG